MVEVWSSYAHEDDHTAQRRQHYLDNAAEVIVNKALI